MESMPENLEALLRSLAGDGLEEDKNSKEIRHSSGQVMRLLLDAKRTEQGYRGAEVLVGPSRKEQAYVAAVLVLVLTSFIAGLAMLAVSWVIPVAVFATPSRKLPPVAAKAGVTVAKVSAATTISNFVALSLPQALEKLLFSIFPVALIILIIVFVISTFSFLLLLGAFLPLGK